MVNQVEPFNKETIERGVRGRGIFTKLLRTICGVRGKRIQFRLFYLSLNSLGIMVILLDFGVMLTDTFYHVGYRYDYHKKDFPPILKGVYFEV